MRAVRLLAPALVAFTLLVGCGGGDPTDNGTGPDIASIEGFAQIEGAPDEYLLLLGGQPVSALLRSDGRYLIEGVPAGQHRVAVVARNGMVGGYATVYVPPGTRVQAPDIVTRLGGQIAGLVSLIEDGTLRPFDGVEITAYPIGGLSGAPEGVASRSSSGDLEAYGAFSNAFGSYVIPAVPPGEYMVTVHTPDVSSGCQWVYVDVGRTAAADFQLRRTSEMDVGTVTGHVYKRNTDGSRVPAAGARVSIISEDPWLPIGPIEPPQGPPVIMDVDDDANGDGSGATPGWPGPGVDIAPPWIDMASTVTRIDGSYSLNAPAGPATIEVYLPGYEPVTLSIIIVAGATVTTNIELDPWVDRPPPPDIDWPVWPEIPLPTPL